MRKFSLQFPNYVGIGRYYTDFPAVVDPHYRGSARGHPDRISAFVYQLPGRVF